MQNQHEIALNKESIELVRQLISDEKALRAQFKVGDRYGFVSEKLNHILKYMQANLDIEEETVVHLLPWQKPLKENERLVYVYLYNAQGRQVHVWEKLLQEKALRDHSINRPIYEDRKQVEAILRARELSPSYAYAAIAVKRNHVIDQAGMTDILGQPLLRLVEGALKTERIIEFVQGGRFYYLDEANHLVPKP